MTPFNYVILPSEELGYMTLAEKLFSTEMIAVSGICQCAATPPHTKTSKSFTYNNLFRKNEEIT